MDSHVREDKWSLDACFGKALLCGEFERSEVVCAKTLYNYVDLGLMEARNHHLPVKLRRSTEERPAEMENREEFRHWEADSVMNAFEELAEMLVYFTHPYTSFEKWSNERHNGHHTKIHPQGAFDADEITNVVVWCNSLSRKILGYRTPDEVFEDELDCIYRQHAS